MWIIKASRPISFITINASTINYSFATASATSSSKSSKKTLYQILEVPSSATMANIKQNYLRLAKIYHPDVYKGKDKDRFTKIQQAYKTLSDRVKRNKYDQELGFARNNKQDFQSKSSNQAGTSSTSNQAGKPKNPMQYQSASSSQQHINLQQQFNKFFNQKSKTQFQQIRLNQQPQIRSMSQAQRIRRHFSQVYQSPDRLSKANFQKQFGSILNDSINQKNRMYEDNVKNQAKAAKRNTEKNIKRTKYKIWIIFGVFCAATLPVMFSLITKYRLDKEREELGDQIVKEYQMMVQESMLRGRLKYQQ